MSTATKLALPNLAQVCPRPRLYDALDRARERPIVWVSGPAGSGKSTLVASYLQHRKLSCVWYEMDARDRDVATLFYELGQVVDPSTTPLSRDPVPVWSSDHPEGARGFSRNYFEILFRRTPAPTLWVFDNCQEVSSDARLFELLRIGFAAIPQGVNVVMISRSGPAPTFTRFLVSSHLAVLGWDDLQLSPEETNAILCARAHDRGLSLTEREVTDLHVQSGGWAAGLVLALECLRGSNRRPDLQATDTSQQVFNFFAAEVFAHVDPDLQVFLIKSALLPAMTGPLLDRLFHKEGSQRILTRLKTDNFFLCEYGTSSAVYRYHPLFREFLLVRALDVLSRQEVQTIRRDAARLFAEAGEPETALDLFKQAGEHAEVANLLISEAPALLYQGRSKTILEWVQWLPGDAITNTPWLAFWTGMASRFYEPGEGINFLQRAFNVFVSQNDDLGGWVAWCGLVQAHILEANSYEPLASLVEWAIEAERLGRGYPAPQIEAKVVCILATAINLFAPHRRDLATHVDRALTLPHGPDADEMILAALVYANRGEMQCLSDVLASWNHYRTCNEISAQGQLFSSMANAIHALYRGDLSSGLDMIKEGLEIAEKSGLFALNGLLLAYAACAHLALGHCDEVDLLIDELAQEIGPQGRALDRGYYHFIISRQSLLLGDAHRAQRHAEQAIRFVQPCGSPVHECNSRINLAEILFENGQIDAARHELAAVESIARSIGIPTTQSLLLTDAYLTLSQGKDQKRIGLLLEEAFSLGAKWECIPAILPTREAIKGLCKWALEREIMVDYTRDLVHRLALDAMIAPDRTSPTADPTPPSRQTTGVPVEFAKDLRKAMHRWHEASELAQNRLLIGRLVEQRTGPLSSEQARVSALQELLAECVRALANNSRTEPMYRALLYTYLEPAGTQLLAAEQAKMSFGTYRRHLAAGLREVATRLWLREHSG